MITQAMILAGGTGTRLGELTKNTPKPLLEVGGRAFLEYIIWNLRRQGIGEILLSVGHLAERIREHFGDGTNFGVRIEYVIEDVPAGTGGPLRLAGDRLQERLFVLNGDTMFDVNYTDLAGLCKGEVITAMALRTVEDCSRFGQVVRAGEVITGFSEKPPAAPGSINGGVYAMNRRIVDYIPSVSCSLERDVLPVLARRGLLHGREYDGMFIDIGVPDSLARGHKVLPAWMREKTSSPF